MKTDNEKFLLQIKTEDELINHIDSIRSKHSSPQEFNYMNQGWGHAVYPSGSLSKVKALQYGSMINSHRPNVGDCFYAVGSTKPKRKFIILDVNPFGDPRDAYWIYFVGIE